MEIRAVLFDLDGTITIPILDFDRIRKEIGGISGPILEAMQQMTDSQRSRAEKILDRHEAVAAEQSRLNPGVHELCSWLRERETSIGLITRNQRPSVERVCQIHNLFFDSVFTREDGPNKPDPYPVEFTCRKMNIEPSSSIMVGDYLFDLLSARSAGAYSVLLQTENREPDFQHEADFVINRLEQLTEVIQNIENH